MVTAALFAALCTVATMIIRISIPATGGYVNLGDCIVLVSGWALGPVWGALAAGIGSMLADVFASYMQFAPATFIIKALMAVAAYYIFTAIKKSLKISTVPLIISAFAAEAIMVGGYFIFESVFLGLGISAASGILGNVAQGIAGIVFGTVVMLIIDKNKFLSKSIKGSAS